LAIGHIKARLYSDKLDKNAITTETESNHENITGETSERGKITLKSQVSFGKSISKSQKHKF
jgi:hypothetical protein